MHSSNVGLWVSNTMYHLMLNYGLNLKSKALRKNWSTLYEKVLMCRWIQGKELYCKHKYARYKYVCKRMFLRICVSVIHVWIFRQGHAHKENVLIYVLRDFLCLRQIFEAFYIPWLRLLWTRRMSVLSESLLLLENDSYKLCIKIMSQFLIHSSLSMEGNRA